MLLTRDQIPADLMDFFEPADCGECFVCHMVAVFREVRRVLRRDGTCWLNIGDSYAHSMRQSGAVHAGKLTQGSKGTITSGFAPLPAGMKEKDLVGIPWRLAFALQADGWYLRSDVIWSKPNPMPESVTDRPTKAHEYLFLLARSPRYFYDADAIREEHQSDALERTLNPRHGFGSGEGNGAARTMHAFGANGAGRNKRSVWEIATEPYPDAHFATFPQALVEPCVLTGTSDRGCCPVCGAPWERETSTEYVKHRPSGSAEPRTYRAPDGNWNSTCECFSDFDEAGVYPDTPVPCTVLDPFMGSGTTALVARRLGRNSIGIELNAEYARLCADRLKQLSLFAVQAGSG